MAVTTKFPFSLPPGLGVHVINGGTFYTGIERVDYTVYIGQSVASSSNALFNTISGSTFYLSPSSSFFDGHGINIDSSTTASPFTITGSLIVRGNMVVEGDLTAPSMSFQ